ncbi:MAG: hypothetical protein RL754_1425 [Bacteroidota bacterium]
MFWFRHAAWVSLCCRFFCGNSDEGLARFSGVLRNNCSGADNGFFMKNHLGAEDRCGAYEAVIANHGVAACDDAVGKVYVVADTCAVADSTARGEHRVVADAGVLVDGAAYDDGLCTKEAVGPNVGAAELRLDDFLRLVFIPGPSNALGTDDGTTFDTRILAYNGVVVDGGVSAYDGVVPYGGFAYSAERVDLDVFTDNGLGMDDAMLRDGAIGTVAV